MPKKEKQFDIDILLLEKYANANDYDAIVDYAYRQFHEEWDNIALKRCAMPNNGGSLGLISEKGEGYIAAMPNRASARAAGALYLMALCKVAGKDYEQLKSRSHKKYTGKNKEEISTKMDAHLDDLKLLAVSLGTKSVIETMTHVRPRWMGLSDEDKAKYLDQILDIATESTLAGHNRSRTIREVSDRLTDIAISRTALQNQLDEYGIEESDIYYIVSGQNEIIIDKDKNKAIVETTLSVTRSQEITSDYENPEGTYIINQTTKQVGDNKVVTETEVKYNN